MEAMQMQYTTNQAPTKSSMPIWLQNQLMRAFMRRDKRNLRMLNDCWFFYRDKTDAAKEVAIAVDVNEPLSSLD
jgi:hypothetical protein